MKVKVFTECGNEIGLGHISRCSSLYDEVKSRGIEVEFIVNGNMKNLDVFKGLSVKFENWLSINYLNRCIESSDYCIVDSYLAQVELYELISSKSRKALYIDDNARLNYPLGIVVNPSLNAVRKFYHKTDTNTYLLGHEYIMLRTPFINSNRYVINKDVKEVLITMGGSDIRNLTPLIMNGIGIKYPDITFNVVISDAFYNFEVIKSIELDNMQLHYNVDAQLMKNLMLQSDISISAAGQTIYELLATNTPFIPIKIIDNQNNNIRGLKKINVNQVVINYDDESIIEKLQIEFKKMLDPIERIRLLTVYKGKVDGFGSKRIIDNLLGVV